MNLKECCDVSVDAFKLVYEAIQSDKGFPEHLPIEAYISAHTEAMKLYMTSIINEAHGKSFGKPIYNKPENQPQQETVAVEGFGSHNQCTDKQARAIFVITHDKVGGKWKTNSRFANLKAYGITNKNDIKNMSFDDASKFIEQWGK